MHSKPKILFLGGGTRCTHFEYFKGYFEVHCTDTDELAPTRDVVDMRILSLAFDSQVDGGFGPYLQRLMGSSDLQYDAIIPASHHSIKVLSDNVGILKELGAKTLLSPASVDICLSKTSTNEFIDNLGFPVPAIRNGKTEYPVFIRPDDGAGSRSCHAAFTPVELAWYAGKAPNPFIQEYIDGDEYTVDIFSDFDANPICVVPRKRIEVRDGEVVKAVTVYDEDLIEQCKTIAKALGLVGMSCIQCIKRDGKYYFIEVNPRFGGGVTLSIHAGANIPLYLSRIMAGETLEYRKDWREGVYMSRAYRDFYSE